jgi:hypothetical protein
VVRGHSRANSNNNTNTKNTKHQHHHQHHQQQHSNSSSSPLSLHSQSARKQPHPPASRTSPPLFAGILFLGDEINTVYHSSRTEALTLRGVECISQCLGLGRGACSFVILSGSTSQLTELVFCERESEWAKLGYSNLNNTVFVPRSLWPIRSLAQCKDYYRRLHDSDAPDDHLLSLTGGVGRALSTYSGASTCARESRAFESLVVQQPELACLLGLVWETNKNAVKQNDQGHFELRDTAYVPIVDRTLVTDILNLPTLKLWEDHSIILINQHSIELLVPQDLCDIASFMDTEQRLAVWSLRVTLTGTANGGLTSEPLVCKHPATVSIGAHGVTSCANHRRIQFVDGKPQFQGCANAPSIDDLFGHIIHASQDHGLDGFVLKKAPEPDDLTGAVAALDVARRRVMISGLQFKLGSMDAHITKGNYEGKHATDTTIAGIVRKAHKGFGLVLNHYLQPLYPDVNFTVDALHLVTNKLVNDAAVKFAEEWEGKGDREVKAIVICSGSEFFRPFPKFVLGALGRKVVPRDVWKEKFGD